MTNKQRREWVEAMTGFEAASAELRNRLCATEAGTARIRRLVDDGEPVLAALEREDLPRLRNDLMDDLTRFEAAKHRMRLATFRGAIDEGAAIADLARAWGFSRQLASRFAKEAVGRQVGRKSSKTPTTVKTLAALR